jgi:hypothetical protein
VPQIVEWVGDQTNLAASKLWAKAWDADSLRDYLHARRVFGFALPAFVMFTGIVVTLGGLF